MASSSQASNTTDLKQLEDEFKQLELSLPKEIWLGNPMHLYQGFWCPNFAFEGTIAFQTHFQAQDNDIILANLPKTGTTWLRSLLFTIVNRKKILNISQHPIHNKHPHELVLHLEYPAYKKIIGNQPDLTEVPAPRLFATHLPYLSLPESIKASRCRIVYICRNPLDTFVSSWHFYRQLEISKGIKQDDNMMEEYLGKFCKGVSPFGPYDNHVLGYWKESVENPQRVLFLEYEGLRKEPKVHLKRLAEFVGCPFSVEEEKNNVIHEIIELCSLKSMKQMEVNKSGRFYDLVENKAFFRKGEVGDWINHLSPSMAKQINQTLLERLKKAGFSQIYYQGIN